MDANELRRLREKVALLEKDGVISVVADTLEFYDPFEGQGKEFHIKRVQAYINYLKRLIEDESPKGLAQGKLL